MRAVNKELSGENIPVPAVQPASELRSPMVVVAIFFSILAGYVCYEWWVQCPIQWKVFVAYWNRDGKYFLPTFPGFFHVWGAGLYSTLLLALFEITSWRAGVRLLAWVFSRPSSGLWGFLLALGLGNGLLGTLTLGLGLNGLVSPLIFWAILIGPVAVWGVRTIATLAKNGRASLPSLRRPGFTWLEWAMVFFSVAIVWSNYVPAVEPEWFYDSLVYHLAVPARWLLHGRICHLPDTFFSNFPFLQEMQFMFFLGLGNDVGARLLHWADGILCALGAFAIASNLFGRTTGIAAAAVFFSLPQLRLIQHVTMVELGMSWMAVLATMCFMQATGLSAESAGGKFPRRSWLFLGAWFLGFGQGTKYLGLFISAILFGWLVLEVRRGKGTWKRLLGDFALITAWGSVWTAPWLAKNFLFTGNPVFPMLGGLLPGLNWDKSLYDRWMYDNTKYGTGHGSLLNWIRMPVMASIDTFDFGTFTLNPFFLVFLPILAFIRTLPVPVVFLGLFSGVYAVVWALTSQQTRFLMPMAPMASVAVAFLMIRAWDGRRVMKALMYAAGAWIFVMSAYGQFRNRFTHEAMVPYMNGYLSLEEMPDILVQYNQVARIAKKVMLPGKKLIFLGGDENYYFDMPIICSSIYDRCAMGEFAKRASDPADLRDRLLRRGVTHMLVYEPRCEEYADRAMFEWGEKPKKVFLDFWHGYGRLVAQSKGVFLFDFSGPAIPADRRKRGKPTWFYPLQTMQKAKNLMARADTCIDEKNYEDGAMVTEDLVRTIPESTHAWAYRAYFVEALSRTGEAIRCYENAIKMGYPTVAAYYNLGVMLERVQRDREALAIYMTGLEVEADYIPIMERAADLTYSFGRYDEAMVLYGKIAESGQGSHTALRRLMELRVMKSYR